MSSLLAIFVILLLFALFWVATYNRLVRLRQDVHEAWSAIETELRRRFDLVPNLVEIVKGYAAHERDTLEEVIRARNSAVSVVSSPDKIPQADSVLSGALRQLFAISEAYPQLKANENFQKLQEQLVEIETNIAQARRFYNANVRELNTAIESFPMSAVAQVASFNPQPYYGLEDADAFNPVQVNFGTTAATTHLGGGSQKIQIPEKQNEI